MKKTLANKKGRLVRQGQGALIRVATMDQLYGSCQSAVCLGPPINIPPSWAVDGLDFVSPPSDRYAVASAETSARPGGHPMQQPTTSSDLGEHDELGFMQLADTAVLARVARGEIDLNALARRELAHRGCDDTGRWVGFAAAQTWLELTA
jgi:hypothetical protein